MYSNFISSMFVHYRYLIFDFHFSENVFIYIVRISVYI